MHAAQELVGARPMRGDWGTYIYKVLKQVHPDIGISRQAMSIMNSFNEDILVRLSSACQEAAEAEAREGGSEGGAAVELSERHVEEAVRRLLPGQLAVHAMREGQRAVVKFRAAHDGTEGENAARSQDEYDDEDEDEEGDAGYAYAVEDDDMVEAERGMAAATLLSPQLEARSALARMGIREEDVELVYVENVPPASQAHQGGRVLLVARTRDDVLPLPPEAAEAARELFSARGTQIIAGPPREDWLQVVRISRALGGTWQALAS